MKRDELKRTLKPLIKECIKEVIFEGGVLSGIITEVVAGLETRRVVTEGVTIQAKQSEQEQVPDRAEEERKLALEHARREHKQQMESQRRSLSESLNGRLNGVDIFEGVDPISKAGQVSTGASAPSSPLDGIYPNDPGVDISKLGIF